MSASCLGLPLLLVLSSVIRLVLVIYIMGQCCILVVFLLVPDQSVSVFGVPT